MAVPQVRLRPDEEREDGEEEAHGRGDRHSKLRHVDVLAAQERPVAEAVKAIGATEVTYSRQRSEHGRLKGDQAKRLKELEPENMRHRRAVSGLTFDQMILAEAA